MTLTAIAIALAASNPAADNATGQVEATAQQTDLSSALIARGESERAVRKLEEQVKANPSDPAVLINLGIAYAHSGEEAKAHAMFKAAMLSSDQIELETADGKTTDPKHLARKAISMLGRGEFRSTSRMTLRD